MDELKLIEIVLKNRGTIKYVPPIGDSQNPPMYRIDIGLHSSSKLKLIDAVNDVINMAFLNMRKPK